MSFCVCDCVPERVFSLIQSLPYMLCVYYSHAIVVSCLGGPVHGGSPIDVRVVSASASSSSLSSSVMSSSDAGAPNALHKASKEADAAWMQAPVDRPKKKRPSFTAHADFDTHPDESDDAQSPGTLDVDLLRKQEGGKVGAAALQLLFPDAPAAVPDATVTEASSNDDDAEEGASVRSPAEHLTVNVLARLQPKGRKSAAKTTSRK
jgi:hypothetical protein